MSCTVIAVWPDCNDGSFDFRLFNADLRQLVERVIQTHSHYTFRYRKYGVGTARFEDNKVKLSFTCTESFRKHEFTLYPKEENNVLK